MRSRVARSAGSASLPVTKRVLGTAPGILGRGRWRPAQAGRSGLPPFTHLLGVPSMWESGVGRHSTVSSIRLASAKSRSVMPLLAWLRSFTHTLPHVTSRSGWCQAASARKPIVLTSASVVSQPSVLYFRRIQRPSYHHPGSSSLSRRSISSSGRTGSFFSPPSHHTPPEKLGGGEPPREHPPPPPGREPRTNASPVLRTSPLRRSPRA